MTLHRTLIQIGSNLGYFEENLAGICNGFTMKWLEACLLNERDIFDRRLQRLLDNPPTLFEVDNIKKIIKQAGRSYNKDTLTADQKEIIDISAFYDNIVLYQNPERYQEWYSETLTQRNIDKMSVLASSEEIAKQGGLSAVHYDIGVYTNETYHSYLLDIKTICDACYDKDHVLAFKITKPDHAIGLTYTVGKGWSIMDTNDEDLWKDKRRQYYDTNEIVRLMMARSFGDYDFDKRTLISTTLISTGHDEKRHDLSIKLQDYKSKIRISLPVIKTTAIQYMTYALQCMSHIMQRKPPPRSSNDDMYDLLHDAARTGDSRLIIALAEHGIDLNHTFKKQGCTAAFIAAQEGHANVIHTFAAYGADLDKPDKIDGCTPAWIAAQNGHAEVIHALADHGADLDKAAKDGSSPALVAASNGNVLVIETLARHGADLNKPAKDGATPAFIAALKGDVRLIEALAVHGADLNLPMADGATPLFLAAQNGHLEILKLLLSKISVDKQIAFHSTVGLVKAALQQMNADTTSVARLEDFIQAQVGLHAKESSKITLLPKDIARIMGHQDCYQWMLKEEIRNERKITPIGEENRPKF